MPFKLSNLNSNLALTLGYLNPALNNSAQRFFFFFQEKEPQPNAHAILKHPKNKTPARKYP